MTTDQKRIALLEERVALLEQFIIANNDDWTDPINRIKNETLDDVITNVVDRRFRVDVSTELVKG